MKKDDIVKEEGDPTSSTPTAADNGVVKANKGMILRKSVEYIRSVFYPPHFTFQFMSLSRYLQQLVTAQGARNRELEQELKAYRSGGTSSSDSISISSPASTAPSNSAIGACDSSSTVTPNSANPHATKRRRNSTQSSIKRRPQSKRSSSDHGDEYDEKDLPLLPDEHEHDESSEGEYDDDLGENGHFGGMLGGMAGMSGLVLADEGMRIEFPTTTQHGQATRPARGRRTARGTSTSLGNLNQQHLHHQPSSHHHNTMQNVQGMNMNNMNLGMFPDGLGMSVPVSMEMEVDPRDAAAAAAAAQAAAIERGRPSTRPGSGPVVLTQKRSFMGSGGGRHPNGSSSSNNNTAVTLSTGNPNGVRLKEEMVDVGVAMSLASNMGMAMGMMPMGMST